MDLNPTSSSATPGKTIAMTWDYGYNIRHSIFLMTGLCVGLPLVGWALRVLGQNRQKGGRESVFIIALLMTDLLEMVLSPAMVVYLLLPDATRSEAIFVLFFSVRYCSLHLHQMVALEVVMARSYLPSISLQRWKAFSILFCLLQSVFLLLCLYDHSFLQPPVVNLMWLLIAVIILGATWMLTLTPTVSAQDSDIVQENDHSVLAVATVSFFALYGPFLAFDFAQRSIAADSFEKHANGILAAMTVIHPAVCLRVFADPLLCVLAVRQLPLDKATASISE